MDKLVAAVPPSLGKHTRKLMIRPPPPPPKHRDMIDRPARVGHSLGWTGIALIESEAGQRSTKEIFRSIDGWMDESASIFGDSRTDKQT